MNFLFRYMRGQVGPLLGTTLLSAGSAGITMLLFTQAFASAHAVADAHSGHPLGRGLLLMLALLVTSAGSQYLLARLGGVLVEQLRTDLSKRFIEVEYERLRDSKHVVFGAIIEDIGRISPLVLIVPQLAYNVILALLCCGYLATLSGVLFITFVAFIAIALCGTGLINRTVHARFDRLRSADDQFFQHVRAIAEGKKELSLNARRSAHFLDALLLPAIKQARELMVGVHMFLGFNIAWSSATVVGAVFGIVFVGQALDVPLATVVQCVAVSLFVVGPLNFIIHSGPNIGSGMASLRHIARIGLDLQSESSTPVSPATEWPASNWQRIHTEGLCYRYPAESPLEQPFIVGPIDFELRRGELLFVSGGNGSGKSTLLLLLCGLLRPTSGSLQIDGRSVGDELAAYRGRFGGVFGDFFLFNHILDNQGRPPADATIRELLLKVELAGHTTVDQGELSKLSLSTGQRKRLALVQCLAEDREILFFDEWAADQDVGFRERFYCEILPELKRRGKTVLVISHDERYFHVADRIVKLERGMLLGDALGPDAVVELIPPKVDAASAYPLRISKE